MANLSNIRPHFCGWSPNILATPKSGPSGVGVPVNRDHEDIGWLDISMHNAFLMRIPQGSSNLKKYVPLAWG